MRRLATVEELSERLSKFTSLSDWLQAPVHEVVTVNVCSPSTEKED